jgi:hypothetical protein
MIPPPLPTIWGTYMKLVTKYHISAINSCREKCDEKYIGTDRGKTVYPDPLRWSWGIISQILGQNKNLPNTLSSLTSFTQYHTPAGNAHTNICKSKKNDTHVVG